MIKKPISLLLIFSFLAVAVSCRTMSHPGLPDVSDAEADYALHSVLESSCKRACVKLETQLKDIDYIPSSHSRLKDRNVIPGLSTLIEEMTDYYASFISENIPYFSTQMTQLSKKLKTNNPVSLVQSSNRSASELFLKQYSSKIKQIFSEKLAKAETEPFNLCVNQYNAYIMTSSFADSDTENDNMLLPQKDIRSLVSEKISKIFFELLQSSEEFYRTTPDPYTDPVLTKVFGIK